MAMLAVSLLPMEVLLTQAEAALVEPMLPRNRRPTSGLLSRKAQSDPGSAVARAIIDFPRVGRLSPQGLPEGSFPDARSWSRNAGLCDEPLRNRF
jgi:hypothetical protein